MLKIMIVDDMEIIKRELKRFKLWGEKSGFVISEEAKDGYEALAKLKENSIDLIITDIRMPKIDGIELLKKVTEKKLCHCIVLMSDHSDFNYARQGLVLGAFDYLVKPVDEGELEKLLERAGVFIAGKKNEQLRVTQLEQSLEDKKVNYFPHVELNQLIELIKNRDVRAGEYAAHVVDIICSDQDNNLIKTEGILNNILDEITNQIKESNKWLDKFIFIDKVEKIKFASFNDLGSIKAAFVFEVEGLMALLKKLQYGNCQNEMIDQVCKCVLENIDGNVSLKAVSDLIFMNKTYISEAFKQKTGISFTVYMTLVKMERAKKLIVEERLKTYEVAQLLGFKDIEYFSKLFKKHTGLPPTEYRQKVLKKD